MTTCPDNDVLRALLADGRAADEVCRHVRQCPACQATLDHLSDDDEVRAWAGARVEETQPEPGLARLLALAPAGPDDLARWLDPPRRPDDLGTLGTYRIERVVGSGGMGIVLRAHDDALNRTVAIKVLRPELAATGRERFLAEARAAARVVHDHVVRIYAVADPPGGLPYLVMEFLAGPTLAEVVRTRGPLPAREAAALVAALADGLAAVHAAGLVHRDVKPGNAMLDPATGRVKLMDFGLVKGRDDPTQTRAIVGTPSYLAPEQAAPTTGGIGPATDVYGLGGVLYELLTGRPPFPGDDLYETLRQVLAEDPVPPRRLRAGVPADLETVCLKCLAKEPRKRYASAAEVAADLRRWLAGEPIQARPAGPVERAWRWCRRHPRTAGLLAAILGLLLLVAVGSTLAAVWIARAHAQAEAERARFAEALYVLVVQVPLRLSVHAGTLQAREDLLAQGRALLAEMAPGTARDYLDCLMHLAQGDLATAAGRPARGEFEQALAGADALLAAQPDNPDFLRCRFRALWQLGDQELAAGRFDAAGVHYDRAAEAVARLGAVRPGDAPAHRDRAVALNKLGRALTLGGRPHEGRQRHEEALRALDAYEAAGPPAAQVLSDRRYTLAQVADARLAANELPAAETAARQALAAARELAGRDADRADWQNDLAFSLQRLGAVYQFRLDLSAAEAAYREAVALRKALAARDDTATSRQNLALAHRLLAEVERHRGRPGDAVASYTAALALSQEIDDPATVRLCRARLSAIEVERENFAAALGWLDREADAAEVAALERLPAALADADWADTPRLLELRGLILARRGDHPAASEAADRLAATLAADAPPWQRHDLLLRAAGIQARCSGCRDLSPGQRQAHTAAAVAALRQALDVLPPADRPLAIRQLALYPDLDPIRDSAPYRELIEASRASHGTGSATRPQPGP